MNHEALAIMRGLDGHWIAVGGPFLDSERPSEDLPSFYVNDFKLEDPLPWKIGRRQLEESELFDRLTRLAPDLPKVSWGQEDLTGFTRVFNEIQERIARGELEKAVPVMVAPGSVSSGRPEALLSSLLQAPEGLLAYGFSEEDRGFCGFTPEILLHAEGRRLDTIALAGTAPAEQAEQLLEDPKEIREHELVAGYLYDKLATLGQVRRHPRGLRRLGAMAHLESRLELHLERNWQVEDLIAKLHPTPALGTQPRTAEALAELSTWRNELDVPSGFGAPFGVYWKGRLEIVVAIRGLWWRGSQLTLPTGCGVIGQSRCENEIAELELKRNWVRQRFGLDLEGTES